MRQIAIVAAAYPVVWGAGQLLTGWLSDHTGRKPLITAGMLVQAGALGLLVAGDGAFAPSLAAALLLGAGTAMVYPTLIAAVSDASQPRDRARVVGVSVWRDFGLFLALIAGIGADATSTQTAILIAAVLTGASGVLAATSWHRARPAAPVPQLKREQCRCEQTESTRPKVVAFRKIPTRGGVTGAEVEIDVQVLKSETSDVRVPSRRSQRRTSSSDRPTMEDPGIRRS